MNPKAVNRRDVLKGLAAGAIALCASRFAYGQQAAGRLTDKLSILDAGGANVIAFAGADAIVLVDSGAPKSGDKLMADLKSLAPNAKVTHVLNTHYHADQTGNNELFGAQGAKIIAQARTKEWLETDYWLPDQDRYEKARPKAAQPSETFWETGSLKTGGEQIDYGYLRLAHTSGDAYYFFKSANVLVVGDAASPLRDPAFDWFTGAWVGGRTDSMDLLLNLANDQTKIVPAYGPVMTKAEFKTERDLMEEVRQRIFDRVRAGEGPTDMLEGGALDGLPRKWKDPKKFLYDAAKGGWAHHDKIGNNVV